MDAERLVLRLNARYAHCIDDGRLEEWPDFFTPDARYSVTTMDNYRDSLEAGIIYADSRDMLRDRVSALRQANIFERHVYRHIFGMPLIAPMPEDDEMREITSETPFLVVRIMRDGASDIFATGRYLDRFHRDAQTVLIRERIVVCDSARIDTLLALPL